MQFVTLKVNDFLLYKLALNIDICCTFCKDNIILTFFLVFAEMIWFWHDSWKRRNFLKAYYYCCSKYFNCKCRVLRILRVKWLLNVKLNVCRSLVAYFFNELIYFCCFPVAMFSMIYINMRWLHGWEWLIISISILDDAPAMIMQLFVS